MNADTVKAKTLQFWISCYQFQIMTHFFTWFHFFWVAVVGRNSQHPEAEETTGQVGAGLRFCQSQVCLQMSNNWNDFTPLFQLSFSFLFLSRWLQATKSIISGTNTQALTAKADLLKEEVDEAMNKVELCKVTRMKIKGTIYLWNC